MTAAVVKSCVSLVRARIQAGIFACARKDERAARAQMRQALNELEALEEALADHLDSRIQRQ